MYKDSESPRKDFEKKPLPGTTASKPPTGPKPRVPHAKPRGADETDEGYAKRTANWQMSQDRMKSVGIIDKNNVGSIRNATKDQVRAFNEKYGHDPAGYKPKDTTKPEKPDLSDISAEKPDMSAENPSKSKKEPSLPSKFNKNAVNQKAPNPPSKNIKAAAAEKAMSSIPGMARKARRKKRLMKKASMQGGTY